MVKLVVTILSQQNYNDMIRRVAFYWVLLTLMLIDSWLLSKPNILGKIGLIIYKYHYLRSFPRTLLTVWIVVSIAVLIVLLVQYLLKQEKLSKAVATVVLSVFVAFSLLIMAKVYIDFTSWSYSHTGLKFRYGAYLLPMILVIIFSNGIFQIFRMSKHVVLEGSSFEDEALETSYASKTVSRDTLRP
jgi:hypothetical protein